MTNETKQRISELLLNNSELLGKELLMPKVFVVNDHPYWFLNVARRAAYGTEYPIEVITIEAAYETVHKKPASMMDRSKVEWNFDQTGDTYGGALFAGGTLLADMCKVPVIVNGEIKTRQIINQQKREFLLKMLKRNENNKSRTAQHLGISPYMLEKRMKEYGITL